MKVCLRLVLFLILCVSTSISSKEAAHILNVSYDPTREFYESYNKFFIATWKKETGEEIEISQSHGGSSAQARAVIDGLGADVVTLALAYDIDLIAQKSKLLPLDWQRTFPNNSCPYTSTIVFLVRKNNPKQIKDWDDLIRSDVQVITPNPKTSGGARWNYMAAWGYALKKYNGNEQTAKEFMIKLFSRVPVLDTAARGATNTFVQRGIGDVLLAWENEAYLMLHKFDKEYQVIRPSVSIKTEPPVAIVIKNTEKKGTTQVASRYLQELYSFQAQDLIAKFFYRPTHSVIAAKYARLFPQTPMFTIQEFGGWLEVEKKHFAEGGLFDQIYHRED